MGYLGVLLLVVVGTSVACLAQSISGETFSNWKLDCLSQRFSTNEKHVQPGTIRDVLNSNFHRTKIDRYLTVTNIFDGDNFHAMCVSFNTKEDKRSKYERAFQKKASLTVWEKVFFEYATIAGVPLREVYAFGPVGPVGPCSCFGAHMENGQLETGLTFCEAFGKQEKGVAYICAAGIAGTTTISIPFPIELLPHHLPHPHGITKPRSVSSPECQNPVGAVINALQRHFSERNAQLTVLDKNENEVEVVVRGLRGEVLRKSKAWERLWLYTVASTKQESGSRAMNLTFILEGYTASGVGDYPPDSAFTTSMEPENSKALFEYVKQLATTVRDEIKGCDPVTND
jgi:hypothetical protein